MWTWNGNISLKNKKESNKSETTVLEEKTSDKGKVNSSKTETYKCSCGDSYTESIPAKEHNFLNFTVENRATCTQDGHRVVKRCLWCDYKETEIIPAGHRFVVDGRCTSCGMEVQ